MTHQALVIEDNIVVQRWIATILANIGFETATVASVMEAKKLVAEKPFTLITCDLVLPGISGFQFLEWLKTDPKKSLIPVIMISAAGYDAEQELAEALGAAAFLPKPFSSQQLITIVANILGMG